MQNVAFRLVVVSALGLSGACAKKGVRIEQPDKTALKEVTEVRHTTLTREGEDKLIAAAGNFLAQVEAAGAALDAGNKDSAQKNIESAQQALKTVERLQPSIRITRSIVSVKKDLDVKTQSEVVADLVPLEQSIADIDESAAPVLRSHVRAAREQLAAGNVQGARNELELARQVLGYRSIYLPVAESARQLERAKEMLDKNQVADAQSTLRSISNGLVYIRSEGIVEWPVVQAARHMLRARAAWADGDRAKADDHIRHARNHLTLLQEQSEAAPIRAEAKALISALDAWERDSPQAEKQLTLVALRADALADLWAQLAYHRGTQTPVQVALLEARYHMLVATASHVVQEDRETAMEEVAAAQENLEEAKDAASDAVKERLSDLIANTQALRDALDSEADHATLYEAAARVFEGLDEAIAQQPQPTGT
jgi:hypothetical protein